MICTFFGHRDAPDSIRAELKSVLTHLIINKKCKTFYVGHQGNFDSIVYSELKKLQQTYSINIFIILSRRPSNNDSYHFYNMEDTIFPEEISLSPPRFAIDTRNKWMLNKSDIVISFAKYKGGAMKFTELAIKKGKHVINLGNI